MNEICDRYQRAESILVHDKDAIDVKKGDLDKFVAFSYAFQRLKDEELPSCEDGKLLVEAMHATLRSNVSVAAAAQQTLASGSANGLGGPAGAGVGGSGFSQSAASNLIHMDEQVKMDVLAVSADSIERKALREAECVHSGEPRLDACYVWKTGF